MDQMILTEKGYGIIPLFDATDLVNFGKKTGLVRKVDYTVHYVKDYNDIHDFLADHSMAADALEKELIAEEFLFLYAVVTVFPGSVPKITGRSEKEEAMEC